MYDPKTGAFYYGDVESGKTGLLQRESAYYIRFNSAKGLYAIGILNSEFKGSIEEKCFHYHVYLDLLFQATGLVSNRFVCTNNNASSDLRQMQELNCEQYGFNKNNYPLLSNKSFRNFIEHIDERDERLATENRYFGTFNLIYPGMDNAIRNELMSEEKPQNNLLNLDDMTYTILEIKKGIVVPNTIFINQLEVELKRIHKISESIWMYLMKAF